LVGLGSVWGKSVRFGSEQTTKPSRRLVWWEVGLVWFCLADSYQTTKPNLGSVDHYLLLVARILKIWVQTNPNLVTFLVRFVRIRFESES
jgi:hypothetical protein